MLVHATAVTISENAVLIIGPAGSGKSSLALTLMAYGATLISDDRVLLTLREGCLWAHAPNELAGMIEARGMGILAAEHAEKAQVRLVVDMSKIEDARLPDRNSIEFLGHIVPCLHKSENTAFPAGVLQYLKSGFAHED